MKKNRKSLYDFLVDLEVEEIHKKYVTWKMKVPTEEELIKLTSNEEE